MPYVGSIGTSLPWIALAHNVGGPTAESAVTILEGSTNGAG